jgi:hypothetical protein
LRKFPGLDTKFGPRRGIYYILSLSLIIEFYNI